MPYSLGHPRAAWLWPHILINPMRLMRHSSKIRHGISLKLYTILKGEQFFSSSIPNMLTAISAPGTQKNIDIFCTCKKHVNKETHLFDSTLYNGTFLHTNTISFARLVTSENFSRTSCFPSLKYNCAYPPNFYFHMTKFFLHNPGL